MMEEKDEILFKAKRLDNGEWIEGYYAFAEKMLCKENTHAIFPYEGFNRWEEIDHKTLCRYTGLIDKNGKKIFESDKLADKYGDTGIVKYGYENCGCCYDVYGFAVDGLEKWINEDVIVIGNIHDKGD